MMCANFCVAVATRPRVITENVKGGGGKKMPPPPPGRWPGGPPPAGLIFRLSKCMIILMVIQKVISSANCLFTHFLLRLQVAFVYSLKLFPELVSMVTKNESPVC